MARRVTILASWQTEQHALPHLLDQLQDRTSPWRRSKFRGSTTRCRRGFLSWHGLNVLTSVPFLTNSSSFLIRTESHPIGNRILAKRFRTNFPHLRRESVK